MKHILVIALLALQCAACSTIVEGPSQRITINTVPEGASCTLNRQNEEIARVNQTPGSVVIDKTKHDITVLCDKPGFEQGNYNNRSGAAAATFGNILIGGLVGWGIDSATGSDNKYDSTVEIALSPSAAPPSAAGPQGPPTPQASYAAPQPEVPLESEPAPRAISRQPASPQQVSPQPVFLPGSSSGYPPDLSATSGQ